MQVRDACVTMLDGWVSVVPAERFLPVAADFLAGPKASAEGKVVGLRWIQCVVAGSKAGRCLDAVLKAAVGGCLDKSAEVREAGNVLLSAIAQVGHQSPFSTACLSMAGKFIAPLLLTSEYCRNVPFTWLPAALVLNMHTCRRTARRKLQPAWAACRAA